MSTGLFGSSKRLESVGFVSTLHDPRLSEDVWKVDGLVPQVNFLRTAVAASRASDHCLVLELHRLGPKPYLILLEVTTVPGVDVFVSLGTCSWTPSASEGPPSRLCTGSTPIPGLESRWTVVCVDVPATVKRLTGRDFARLNAIRICSGVVFRDAWTFPRCFASEPDLPEEMRLPVRSGSSWSDLFTWISFPAALDQEEHSAAIHRFRPDDLDEEAGGPPPTTLAWQEETAAPPDGMEKAGAAVSLTEGSQLRIMRGHADLVSAVAIDRIRKDAVSAACDNTLRIWCVEEAREKAQLSTGTDCPLSLAFHPRRTELLACGFASGSIVIYSEPFPLWPVVSTLTPRTDISLRRAVQVLQRSGSSPVMQVLFLTSSERIFLVSWSLDGTIVIRDESQSFEAMATIDSGLHGNGSRLVERGIAATAHGILAFVTDSARSIVLLNVPALTEAVRWSCPDGVVPCRIAVRQDDSEIGVLTTSGNLIILDLRKDPISLAAPRTLEVGANCTTWCWIGSGDVIAAGQSDCGVVSLHGREDLEGEKEFLEDPVSDLAAYSPGVVVVAAGASLYVWKLVAEEVPEQPRVDAPEPEAAPQPSVPAAVSPIDEQQYFEATEAQTQQEESEVMPKRHYQWKSDTLIVPSQSGSSERRLFELEAVIGMNDGTWGALMWIPAAGKVLFSAGSLFIEEDIATGKQRFYPGHSSAISAIAATGNALCYATGSEAIDGGHSEIFIWKGPSKERNAASSVHTSAVQFLAFSQDGKLLVSAGALLDRQLALWVVSTCELLSVIRVDHSLHCICVDTDDEEATAFFTGGSGRLVKWHVIEGSDGNRKIIEAVDGDLAPVSPRPVEATSLVCHRGILFGALMAGRSVRIGVWDSETLAPIGRLPTDDLTGEVDALAVVRGCLLIGGFESVQRCQIPQDARNLGNYGPLDKIFLHRRATGLVKELVPCETTGDILASSSEGTGTLLTSEGKAVIVFKGHSAPITAASAACSIVATGDSGGSLVVRAKSGVAIEHVWSLKPSKSAVLCLAVDEGVGLVASGHSNGYLGLSNLRTMSHCTKRLFPPECPVKLVCFAISGKVVAASEGTMVSVVQATETGPAGRTLMLPGHPEVSSLASSPHDPRLLVAAACSGGSGTVRVWALPEAWGTSHGSTVAPVIVADLEVAAGGGIQAAFHPASRSELVVCQRDGSIVMHDFLSHTVTRRLRCEAGPMSVCIEPKSSTIAVLSERGEIATVDAASGQVARGPLAPAIKSASKLAFVGEDLLVTHGTISLVYRRHVQ